MFARAPLSWGQLLAVLLVGVVIVYLLIAALSPGYVSDIGTNKVWGRHVAREGIHDIYRIPTDYPPVLLYFFGAAGELYERLVDPPFAERTMLASQLYTFLIKLPGIIFHPVVAASIYLLVRRFGPGIAFGAAAAYALNPAVAYDVAHLGQTDPVHTAFALLSIGALVFGQPLGAGALIALAALTKPQAWILLPVVGLGLVFWYGRRGVLRGMLGGLVATAVVLAPWIATSRLHHAERFLEALDSKSVNAQALTAQAHNLWWIPTLLEWRFINDWERLARPAQLPDGRDGDGSRADRAGGAAPARPTSARSSVLAGRDADGGLVRGDGARARESPVHGPPVPGRRLGAGPPLRHAVRAGLGESAAQPRPARPAAGRQLGVRTGSRTSRCRAGWSPGRW